MPAEQDRLALECFFNTLDDEELGPCWFYEYLREFVLRMSSEQAGAYRQEITQLRELVRSKTAKEARIILMEQHRGLPVVIPVMFEPEWPDTPYQAIVPKDQRVKRLRDWLPEFFPDTTEYLLENLLPFRMPDLIIESLAAKLREGKHPVVTTEHVHSWIEYMFLQHTLGSDYRLDTIYRRHVAVIMIDPTIGQAAFLRRAKALWQMLVGDEQQTRMAGRPAGSQTAKNRPELQQLGAYRMVEVFGLSIDGAIAQLIERLDDDAYYTDPRSFQRAVDEAKMNLARFLQLPNLNAE